MMPSFFRHSLVLRPILLASTQVNSLVSFLVNHPRLLRRPLCGSCTSTRRLYSFHQTTPSLAPSLSDENQKNENTRSLEVRINLLINKVDSLGDVLGGKIDSLDDRMDNVETQLQSVQTDMGKMRTDMDQQFNTLETAMNSQFDKLNVKVDRLELKTSSLVDRAIRRDFYKGFNATPIINAEDEL